MTPSQTNPVDGEKLPEVMPIFKLCHKCNKEFEVVTSRLNNGFTSSFQDCPHCGVRNDTWIHIPVDAERYRKHNKKSVLVTPDSALSAFQQAAGKTGETNLSRDEIMDGLGYIGTSPAPEYGGFHPNTVKITASAAALVIFLESQLASLTAERDVAVKQRDIANAEYETSFVAELIRDNKAFVMEVADLRQQLTAALSQVEQMRGAMNAVIDLSRGYDKSKFLTWEDSLIYATNLAISALSQVPPTEK